MESNNGENNSLDNAQFRLEWLLTLVLRYHQSNIIKPAVVDFLSEALAIISGSFETERDAMAEHLFSETPGRLKSNISREQIEFLLERRFTTAQMSRLLAVSLCAIERRMAEFGATVRSTYTNISANFDRIRNPLGTVAREFADQVSQQFRIFCFDLPCRQGESF